MDFPRMIIAALRGGSGKTILSIGIIAAWKTSGYAIAPFKKGPDYIDAGWLALAAGRPCYNLDSFLIPPQTILDSFLSHTHDGDIALVEGNRGLYDGIDIEGSTSTAELAKLLHTPIVLCIDCTKATRTMAAVVLGCSRFDSKVQIKGVVLNQVAGLRHENILRESIEYHCGIPVLGAIPKLENQYFPERHMGLVPTSEHAWAQESIKAAARMARDYINLDMLHDVAMKAGPLWTEPHRPEAPIGINVFPDSVSLDCDVIPPAKEGQDVSAPRIGIIKDAAFQFYYPENLEALKTAGAVLVYVSPLKDTFLPELDGLYIGGGFPETHARQLSENVRFRDDIKVLADGGFPIYAECGGLMYLGEMLLLGDTSYPMAGVLPIIYDISEKPQGHGYTILSVESDNPYFSVGTEIRGHEFHYSRMLQWRGQERELIFRMKRGKGFLNRRDGIRYKNVLATYTHIHALGTPEWPKAMIRNAAAFRMSKKRGQPPS